MKLDILVFASHPDDAELGCAGTIISQIEKGNKVGIVDLTMGELGTRGNIDSRAKEAATAAELLKLSARENLRFADGFFENDKSHLIEVIKVIRKYQPEIVIANAIKDRHPDHGQGARLVSRACFLSGLVKIETGLYGQVQEAWRPKQVYHYLQDRYINPDFVVDITPYWAKKVEAIKAYQTQFHNPDSKEPLTYISTPDFLPFIEARAMEMGHAIGVKYAEGFTKEKQLGVKNLFDLL